jgi:hypothetical protein
MSIHPDSTTCTYLRVYPDPGSMSGYMRFVVGKVGLRRVSKGRGMVQAVSYRPFTVGTWLRFQANPRGICGGQSGTETRFCPSTSDSLHQYHSTSDLYPCFTHGGCVTLGIDCLLNETLVCLSPMHPYLHRFIYPSIWPVLLFVCLHPAIHPPTMYVIVSAGMGLSFCWVILGRFRTRISSGDAPTWRQVVVFCSSALQLRSYFKLVHDPFVLMCPKPIVNIILIPTV